MFESKKSGADQPPKPADVEEVLEEWNVIDGTEDAITLWKQRGIIVNKVERAFEKLLKQRFGSSVPEGVRGMVDGLTSALRVNVQAPKESREFEDPFAQVQQLYRAIATDSIEELSAEEPAAEAAAEPEPEVSAETVTPSPETPQPADMRTAEHAPATPLTEERIVPEESIGVSRVEAPEWKQKLKGTVEKLQAITAAAIERTKKTAKELYGYVSERGAKLTEKLKSYIPGFKSEEDEPEAAGSQEGSPRFEKLKQFIKGNGEGYGARLKELGIKTGSGVLELGKKYNALPFKVKLAVGAALLGGSAAMMFTGGAASVLAGPLSALALTRRAAAVAGGAAIADAFLERKGVSSKKARWLIIGAGAVGGVTLMESLQYLSYGGSTGSGGGADAAKPGIADAKFNPKAPDTLAFPGDAAKPGAYSFGAEKSFSIGDVNAKDVSIADSYPEAPHFNEHGFPKEPVGASIHEAGQGANQMFLELKAQLRELYKNDIATAPPEIQEIVKTRVHDLSAKYGFLENGKFPIMYHGDQIQVNGKGELVFTRNGGTPEILKQFVSAPAADVQAPSFDGPVQPQSMTPADAAAAPADPYTAYVPEGGTTETIPQAQSAAPADSLPAYQPSGSVSESAPTQSYAPSDTLPAYEGGTGAAPSVEQLKLSDGTVIDSKVPHLYETKEGSYLFGGESASADQTAKLEAARTGKPVFVNHSYNNAIGERVVVVHEFAPGSDLPNLHNDPAYDLEPKRGFIKLKP